MICPYCGYSFDAHLQVAGEPMDGKPVAGSFCVCIDCAEVSRVCSDMELRRITQDDLMELGESEIAGLRMTQLAVLKYRKLEALR